MRYPVRSQVSPTVRAEVDAPNHPEYRRVFELPLDAPSDWLARAYLLSIGIEADALTEPALTLRPAPRIRTFSPWGDSFTVDLSDDVDPSEDDDRWQELDLAQCPVSVRVKVSEGRTPEIGEAQVALLEEASVPRRAENDGGWESAMAACAPDRINAELVRLFGVAVPRYSSTVSVPLADGVPESSLLGGLLRSLAPTRRLALLDHLDRHPAVTSRPMSSEAAGLSTRSLHMLIERLGPDGVEQDESTGWLPVAVIRELETCLDLPSPGADDSLIAALVETACHLRLIRRHRGRVVPLKSASGQLSKPAVAAPALALEVTRPDHRSWASKDVVLTLLALADGSAATTGDLPGIIARGREALAVRGLPDARDWEDWYSHSQSPERPATETGTPSDVRTVLDRLAALSGDYTFTPLLREIARVALTHSSRL